MELLLTLGVPAADGPFSHLDISVDLDLLCPVADLRDAVVEWIAQRGTPGVTLPEKPVLAITGNGPPRPLDPDLSVFDAGVLSGQVIDVIDIGAAPLAPIVDSTQSDAVAFDVTSGPEAGRSIAIGPGRYQVGRARSCEISLADPALSRQHFAIEVSPSLEVLIEPNPEATNGTFLAGERLDESRSLRPEQALFAGSSQLVLRGARFDVVGHRDRLGQVSFNPLPYRRPIVRERKLPELDRPPERPGLRRFPLATLLIPIAGAVLFVWLTKRVEFLLLAGLSPLMMVSNHVSEGRSSKRTYARERVEFLQRVDARQVDVEQAVGEERQERMTAAPDIPLLARQVRGRLRRLWERPRHSPDFLEMRLGLGTQATCIETPLEPGGDPALRDTATERLSRYRSLTMVPVTLSLDEVGTTGLFGPAEHVRALATSLVIQATSLHSPEDLVIAAAMPSSQLGQWSWLKWLPHSRSATSPLEGAQLVDETGVDDLLLRLSKVVTDRSTDDKVAGAPWPRVMLLLHADTKVDRALLATLLDASPPAGIATVWVGEDEAQLPRQCRATIRCASTVEEPSMLRFTDPKLDDQYFELEGIPAATSDVIARALAPVRDVSAASVTTGIPRLVTLFELPGVPPAQGRAIASAWSAPRPYGLEATIGMGANGPFSLDLVADGPHALIAGTSGAGKSELLQTLVIALATRYSPQRLNLLFIDYKGGASSAAVSALPHTVGSVTNLDERLALRALTSLRAELNRRMSVLEGRAKDLAEMLKVAPDDAPPSLVIVVDEFATLVKEIPDFVAGMVDVAQRGRSLGIHLVLATQRPTGAVNENILANTNLRVALRVVDTMDSRAVIDSKEAAAIPVPLRGRAYARTGPGALTPFQCAWAGAPYLADEQLRDVVVRPYPFYRDDVQALGPGRADEDTTDDRDASVETQLGVMVRSCHDAAELIASPAPRRPWVEPLPEQVSLEDVVAIDPEGEQARRADPGRRVVLGVGDLPAEQRQLVIETDLEQAGGLLVFGGGGSGKTTLLRTVACGLAEQGSPDEVQLYVLDFSGRALTQLEELPHVVAAAGGDDLEKVTRILTVLRAELERRRRVLAEARVDALSALRAKAGAGGQSMPRLVLLLDSYAGFHATFEVGALFNWVMELQQLVTEGRQVGIHVVMTTTRQLGVPTAITAAIAARIVLRMATADELIALGIPRQAALGADLGPGRGFAHGGTELQVATVSTDPSGAAQAAAVTELADRLRAAGTRPADRLPELPDVYATDGRERGPAVADPSTGTPLGVPLGLADLTLNVATVDLGRQNLVILGPPTSGRSTALVVVVRGLKSASQRAGDHRCLVGLGGLNSPLAQLDCWDVAGFGRTHHQAALDAAAAVIDGYEGDEVKVVLVIDTVEDLDAIEYNMRLEPMVRSDAVRVAAAADPATLERAYSGWLAELKRNRAVLVLQPESAADVEAATRAKPSLRPGQRFPPGRGVLVDHGRPVLIQVATGIAPARANGQKKRR